MSARGLLLAMLLLPLWAGAQEGEAALLDRVSLQAQATREVANDRMRAELVVQAEDRDPARLADQVNRTMQWALERAERVKPVSAKTAGYRTQPVYRDGTLTHWRAVQTLVLESEDFPALSELVGTLQERLAVQSMRFLVSDAQRQTAENALIDDALGAFKARAERVVGNLNAGGWRIVHIDIGTHDQGPGPVMMMRAEAMADRPPPALAGGTSEVTVTVSGTVQLLPGSR